MARSPADGKEQVQKEPARGQRFVLEIAERGIMNILKHAGVVAGDPDIPNPSHLIHTPTGDAFITSRTDGLFEICTELGSHVNAGDLIARVHYLEDPDRAPTLTTNKSGLVVCRHVPALITRGDCAAVIAVD